MSEIRTQADLRQPAVAGQFYPMNPTKLRTEVLGYLSNVPAQKTEGLLIGLMVPHAAYIYSAKTASYGYGMLTENMFETVILIGNSHNYYLKKGAVYPRGAFLTPLGKVDVDEDLAAELIKNSTLLEANISAHHPEHSLEVQLPFLQLTIKNFKIVPILLSGTFSLKDCQKLAENIVTVLKKSSRKALLIASSDMSHFPSDRDARLSDLEALKAIEKFDIEHLSRTIDATMKKGMDNLDCVLCGREAVYTTMHASKLLGAETAIVLNYSNSSDVSGDSSRVVGYGAAAFVNVGEKSKIKSEKGELKEEEFKISEKNQKFLLELARKSISEHLASKKISIPSTADDELRQNASVFVTLTINGKLRGCIGTTVPQKPLIEAVSDMAIEAATSDPRFPPISKEEFKKAKIEISILSPMKRASSSDAIKPNVHGVFIKKGRRGGLFLPQVWEHFSKKEEFLSELCQQKAGLDPEAWKEPSTELYIFTVLKFEE